MADYIRKFSENKGNRKNTRNFPLQMLDILVPFKELYPWIRSNRISYLVDFVEKSFVCSFTFRNYWFLYNKSFV